MMVTVVTEKHFHAAMIARREDDCRARDCWEHTVDGTERDVYRPAHSFIGQSGAQTFD